MFFRKLYIRLMATINLLTMGHRMQYKEACWRSPKVPPRLDGYVIAFITDTHDIAARTLERVRTRIDDRKVDLLLLGGDFADAPETTLQILGKTRTADGIWGVEGNHDEYVRLFAAMEANNVRPLINSGAAIRPGLFLAGVEDLWNRKPDVPLAVKNAKPDDLVVLLCHNPDMAMSQDTSRVDIMLCGHNHGGQITLFGLWAPFLWPYRKITHYGHKFKSGWAKAPHNTDVFVSNGTGTSQYKPRIFARPQVIFLTLRHAGETSCA